MHNFRLLRRTPNISLAVDCFVDNSPHIAAGFCRIYHSLADNSHSIAVGYCRNDAGRFLDNLPYIASDISRSEPNIFPILLSILECKRPLPLHIGQDNPMQACLAALQQCSSTLPHSSQQLVFA